VYDAQLADLEVLQKVELFLCDVPEFELYRVVQVGVVQLLVTTQDFAENGSLKTIADALVYGN
jgi:hypothetical protein